MSLAPSTNDTKPAADSAADAAASPALSQHGAASHANLVPTALTVGLVVALLTIGVRNAVLVVVVSALLVCNPWVRTLLELPSTGDKRGLSTFDPARYLLSYTPETAARSNDASSAQDDTTADAASQEDALMQTDRLYSLSEMPDALRQSSQTMIRFVVRDFVQGWYDNLTFAHPNFPISAEANISHTATSVYLRSRQLKSANTSAEMLLTVQSVLLSSLRRRRISNQYSNGAAAAAAARSTWPSTAARVDALRKAVRKFLSRNLAPAERSSPVVMLLLTEVVAKQAWQVVHTIGDPDFINQKIVQWAEPASETSLEAQTISPEELERLKSLDTAALDRQTSEASNAPAKRATQPNSFEEAVLPTSSLPTQPFHAPVPRSRSPDTVPQPKMSLDAQPRANLRMPPASASHPAALADRARPRATPPKKSNSSGPFSALGGFATGALGALADAAERAVDVVGGTVDEFGNMLMVPADPSARAQNSGSGTASPTSTTSPRRRYALLAEREAGEVRPGSPSPNRTGANDHANRSAPAYHLDMPSGVDEPELPASLRQSLRTNTGSDATNEPRGFEIPETPQHRSYDAPAIVAPAPVAAALNFASRDSMSMDSNEGDAQSSLEAMHQLLSDRSSAAYDAFEAFLEEPGNRYCAPNEGESLLRLHTQLNTLASIMEFTTLDEQTFRADASTILSKALEQLPSTLPPTHDGQQPVLVRRSAQQVLTNLEWCANMDVVEPLRENIIARLVQLHNALRAARDGGTSEAPSAVSSPMKTRFDDEMARSESPEPNQLRAFLERENRPSFSSTDSERGALRYEPRRKPTGPATQGSLLQPATQTPPRAPSVPPGAAGGAPVMGPPLGPSRPMSVPPRVPSAPPRAQPMVLPGHAAEAPRQSMDAAPASNSFEVSVTDISANAESGRAVDVRTFEVMISVEGVGEASGAGADGFVLVRRWHEFEQMDAEVQRQPRSSRPLPRLPVVKGRRSAEVCGALEVYLGELLHADQRAQLAAVGGARRFLDRTRAGASVEDLRRKGGAGALLGGIGKGIVSGVGMVGKQTAKTATATAATAASAATAATVATGMQAPGSPVADSASGTTSAFVSRANSPSASPSRRAGREGAAMVGGAQPATGGAGAKSELSARQLDMLLSSIFAVADEAFNVQGGWTLRRGMLRVLEQVVRTTYASSIVAGFNNAAAGLNVENAAKWIAQLTETMWPNGRRWGSEIGTPDEVLPRTEAQKRATAERARQIVVSYAPAQAGYVLGPGGKMACVKALAEVHETVMDPITASDLGLTVVLKALDMASR